MNTDNYRQEYIARINKAIDFIEDNIYEELNLEKISKISGFSPFHFHRIFKAFVGETLNRFLQRIRIEKAAGQLINNPKKSITDIAFDCGFSGSASFARVFKDKYGISASEWQRKYQSKNGKVTSNFCISESNNRKDSNLTFHYNNNIKLWRLKMKNSNEAKFEVKELKEKSVAYVRHIGSYKGNSKLFEELFTKITKWAGARDLLNFPETQFLTVYHDDPNITDEKKLRISVGITLSKKIHPEGEVGIMTIPEGKYVIGEFELKEDEFEEAWNSIYSKWFPESGYQPAEGVCFEVCLNNPKEHPEHKFLINICIPVKPL